MARIKIGDLAFAVVVAVVVGGGAGLAVGFVARYFGWPTGFVGSLTGGIVSALTISLYHMRAGIVAKRAVVGGPDAQGIAGATWEGREPIEAHPPAHPPAHPSAHADGGSS